MNLATRCTACGTIFRVVQDQLKVSEGWVRCGRCQAVFNAEESLFDLERDSPPPWQPAEQPVDLNDVAESTGATQSNAEPVEVARVSPTGETATEPEPDSESDPWDQASDQSEPAGPPPTPDIENGEIETEHPAATPNHEIDHDEGLETPSGSPETEAEQTSPADGESPPADPANTDSEEASAAPISADTDSPSSTPDFVRQAERDEWWQQTPVRATLVVLAVVGALGLALQITGHYRQRIAAQWPVSTPWLQRYCAVFGCSLEPLRRIDDVSIESTALTQADASLQGEGVPNALRLAVTLRNRGELPIAMPSVDLSLTGADGELVSRRALAPSDFQVTDPRLKPGVDAPLSVSFSVTGRRVSGYTVEVFYP